MCFMRVKWRIYIHKRRQAVVITFGLILIGRKQSEIFDDFYDRGDDTSRYHNAVIQNGNLVPRVLSLPTSRKDVFITQKKAKEGKHQENY